MCGRLGSDASGSHLVKKCRKASTSFQNSSLKLPASRSEPERRLRRLWLEKQEKAFGVWLNAALAPPPPGGRDSSGGDGGLAAKRLEARVRGALWHLYCGDATVLEVVTRLEKRVDEGFLRLKPEVRPKSHPSLQLSSSSYLADTIPDIVAARVLHERHAKLLG